MPEFLGSRIRDIKFADTLFFCGSVNFAEPLWCVNIFFHATKNFSKNLEIDFLLFIRAHAPAPMCIYTKYNTEGKFLYVRTLFTSSSAVTHPRI